MEEKDALPMVATMNAIDVHKEVVVRDHASVMTIQGHVSEKWFLMVLLLQNQFKRGLLKQSPQHKLCVYRFLRLFLVIWRVLTFKDVSGCAAMVVSLTAEAPVLVTAFATVGRSETNVHKQQWDEKHFELQQRNVPSSATAIMEQHAKVQLDVKRHKFDYNKICVPNLCPYGYVTSQRLRLQCYDIDGQ